MVTFTSAENPILADAKDTLAKSRKKEYRNGMDAEGALRIAVAFGNDAVNYIPGTAVTQEHLDHARAVWRKAYGVYGMRPWEPSYS